MATYKSNKNRNKRGNQYNASRVKYVVVSKRGNRNQDNRDQGCYRCGKPGHYSRECDAIPIPSRSVLFPVIIDTSTTPNTAIDSPKVPRISSGSIHDHFIRITD
eukprot:262499_1